MTHDRAAHPGSERVVLLSDDHTPIGSMPKELAHTATTPLHLAFSCYVADGAGKVLMTRRALGKQTWPGVWTNTCCGHPAPGEDPSDAVRRRLRYELGLEVAGLTLVLPDFSYRAVDVSGVVENEFCPVWAAQIESGAVPEPAVAEVAEWAWVDFSVVTELALTAPALISPWASLQVPRLIAAGWLADPALTGT